MSTDDKRGNEVKKRNRSLWLLVGLFFSGCGGGPHVSSATDSEVALPKPRIKLVEAEVTAEPETIELKSEYTIVDPVVTELRKSEYNTILYGNSRETKPHNSASRELERALMNWLLERPIERACVTVDEAKYKEKVMAAYAGETIGVIGPDYLTLPLVAVGDWIHMTKEQLEKQAKSDCLAIP